MKIIGDIQVIRSEYKINSWTWFIDVGPESEQGMFRREAFVESRWIYKTDTSARAAARRWFERLGLNERGVK